MAVLRSPHSYLLLPTVCMNRALFLLTLSHSISMIISVGHHHIRFVLQYVAKTGSVALIKLSSLHSGHQWCASARQARTLRRPPQRGCSQAGRQATRRLLPSTLYLTRTQRLEAARGRRPVSSAMGAIFGTLMSLPTPFHEPFHDVVLALRCIDCLTE